MTPTDPEIAQSRHWQTLLRCEPRAAAPSPFSFVCGRRRSSRRFTSWPREHSASEACNGVRPERTVLTDPETRLAVAIEAKAYTDFPAVEWLLRLTNGGESDSPILRDIQALDTEITVALDAPCVLRYSIGSMCTRDDFALVERPLAPGARFRLQPGGGRSSSEVLPFFNLCLGSRGIVLAIGWTGEWAAEFQRLEDGSLRVRVGMDHTRLALNPGESIRTPSVLLLCWEGEPIRGHNLLRRLILRHHRPRPNGEPLIAPLCNGNWGGTPAAVHLANLRTIVEHDLPFEYYWIDANWFGAGGPYWEEAGNWTPRTDLYPEGLRPISDLAHRHGRKFLLWFEPERVSEGTPWAREHPEWLLEVPPQQAIAWGDYGTHLAPEEWARMESNRNQLSRGDRLLNLGHPDARRFLTDFLSQCVADFGIDCLRWDSNIAQLAYWRHADPPDRRGITEIRYVEGQYALWDDLLARHPHLWIDGCGSGSRRLDLESISRTTPLWRTDHVHMGGGPTASQCQTHGLLRWVPINGTTAWYLDRADRYSVRSAMCAALQAGLTGHGDAPQQPIPVDYPFDHARRLLQEYLDIRDYYYGDYYPLTECSHAGDAWLAYQLDRPERGDGLVVVLKRPRSPFTHARLPLQALDPGCDYQVTDLDSGAESTVSGAELADPGLRVELTAQPDSALIRYRRLYGEGNA